MKFKLYLTSVTLLLLIPSIGFACTCAGESLFPGARPVEEQVGSARKESAAVFSGVVTRIVFNKVTKTYEAQFKVYKSWKGIDSGKVSVFRRADFPCMYTFEVGEKYLVYAYESGVEGAKRLEAGACGRTTFLRYASEDMQLLGKGKAINNERSASSGRAKPNNGMHPTANSAAFMRKTCRYRRCARGG
jgi:hypothetical protein